MKSRETLLAVAAGFVFADATIVTLALPSVLVQLHTTVEGVAAVLGTYTAALALAAIPVGRLAFRIRADRLAPAALAAFGLAGVACAAAPGLGTLLVARTAQGVAGAAVLAVAGDALAATPRGRRLWPAVTVVSAAVGPAVGGALTQAFSWRAIFIAQAPVPFVAAVLCRIDPPTLGSAGEAVALRRRGRPILALGLVSAALTALLFGLVLLLVAGWAFRPLAAAAAVSVVPVAAYAGSRVRGSPYARVCMGAVLIATGIEMLAFLPSDQVRWLVLPQVAAGLGMGLALTPLLDDLMPESTPDRRATNAAVRHLGTTLALVVLAPLIAHDLARATERAKLQTVAVGLDAEIDPVQKLELAPALGASVRSENPLASVRVSAARERSSVSAAQRPAYDRLVASIGTIFVRAANDAFRRGFMVAGAFALAAALLYARRARTMATAAIAAGVVLVGAQALVHRFEAPAQVRLADPCRPRRTLPHTGGVGGRAQSTALTALDKAACFLGSSREELVLALASDREARRFERRHGVDPRSVRSILKALGKL